MKSLLKAVLLLSSSLLIAECCQDPCFDPCVKVSRDRLVLRNLEGTGIGFNRGYSSVDLFLSSNWGCQFYPFVDLRGHIFNNGKWAANGGLGLRWVPEAAGQVYGVNVFYDFYEPRKHAFQQIGAGLEMLTECWSVRLNGYFPFQSRSNKLKEGFSEFSGHNAIFYRKQEFSFMGTDLELGRVIWRNNNFAFEAILGGYFLDGKFGKKAGGGFLRLKANATRYLTLQGQASYDNYFNWNGSGELALNIPFGGRTKVRSECLCPSEKLALEQRLVESVGRFEIMPIATHKQHGRALDPVTGLPLNFVFVDNLRGSSDGSFENPYRTLLDAQSNSEPGDVIYVFYGNGTSSGMDNGIALQNNQRFLGSGVSHRFSTRFGTLKIGPQSVASPLIEGPLIVGAQVVTLANNNEVSGFNFQGGYLIVAGLAIKDALITHNTFAGFSAVPIAVINCLGTITADSNSIHAGVNGIAAAANGFSSFHLVATNNFIEKTAETAISASSQDNGSLRSTIRGNLLFANNQEGIEIRASDNSSNNAILQENKVLNCGDEGIIFNSLDAGTITAQVQSNAIRNSGLNGIIVTNAQTGFISFSASNNLLSHNANPFTFRINGTGNISLELIENNVDNLPIGYEFLNTGTGKFLLKGLKENVGIFDPTNVVTITD